VEAVRIASTFAITMIFNDLCVKIVSRVEAGGDSHRIFYRNNVLMDVLSFRATHIYASGYTYIDIVPHVYTLRATRIYA
jgi:hypothetical protein